MGTVKAPIIQPDLAPSDYHLFLHLKQFLAGLQFCSDDELQEEAQFSLTLSAATWYEVGVKKLALRFEKCLHSGINYVES